MESIIRAAKVEQGQGLLLKCDLMILNCIVPFHIPMLDNNHYKTVKYQYSLSSD